MARRTTKTSVETERGRLATKRHSRDIESKRGSGEPVERANQKNEEAIKQHYGTQFHHGPLPARLSLSRSATTRSVGRNPADHSRSSPQADSTSYHAALVFQCFEGIELLHVQTVMISRILVLRLQPLRRLILQFLGPPYEKFYFLSG